MSDELLAILTSLQHLTAISIVLTAGLYGLTLYASLVMTRILREVQREVGEVLRRLPERR